MEEMDEDLRVLFLREKGNSHFEYPVVPDESWVGKAEVTILSTPKKSRRSTKMYFEDFENS
jgi:hypothetical protein